MIARFKTAFARTLPHLPPRELSWRLHFLMGALSYTLAGTDVLKLISALNPGATDDDELLLRRLGPFLVAGLQAPLADLSGLPTHAPAAAVMAADRHRPARARRKDDSIPSARRNA
jgi:hypothetical protein